MLVTKRVKYDPIERLILVLTEYFKLKPLNGYQEPIVELYAVNKLSDELLTESKFTRINNFSEFATVVNGTRRFESAKKCWIKIKNINVITEEKAKEYNISTSNTNNREYILCFSEFYGCCGMSLIHGVNYFKSDRRLFYIFKHIVNTINILKGYTTCLYDMSGNDTYFNIDDKLIEEFNNHRGSYNKLYSIKYEYPSNYHFHSFPDYMSISKRINKS